MASINEGLLTQLQGAPMERIAQQLGLDPAQAAQAVQSALPLLMGALGRNTQQPEGAQSLFGALQKDHTGLDLGSVLGSVLGGGGQGGSILGHIFGQRREVASEGLGQVTGLSSDKASILLKVLAPLVLAYLGKRMFDKRADARADADAGAGDAMPAATPQVLSETLGKEEKRITQQGGATPGLLGAIFDRNRDGNVDFRDIVGGIAQR